VVAQTRTNGGKSKVFLNAITLPTFPFLGKKKLNALNHSPIRARAIVFVRRETYPICGGEPTLSAMVTAYTCEGKPAAFPIDPI